LKYLDKKNLLEADDELNIHHHDLSCVYTEIALKIPARNHFYLPPCYDGLYIVQQQGILSALTANRSAGGIWRFD
jgi:hypothetical protein